MVIRFIRFHVKLMHFSEYLLWVKLLFTICLSFHFFGLAVCLKDFRKFELVHVLFSIICPLLFAWIPLFIIHMTLLGLGAG